MESYCIILLIIENNFRINLKGQENEDDSFFSFVC